ncbi:MAG: hypothetical protein IJS74_03805 [Clostridia bacterium]|nr:hypothetical protein [Clostridia bacterium]
MQICYFSLHAIIYIFSNFLSTCLCSACKFKLVKRNKDKDHQKVFFIFILVAGDGFEPTTFGL